MAAWCLTTRQTPDVYLQLTALERSIFEDEAKGLRERGWI